MIRHRALRLQTTLVLVLVVVVAIACIVIGAATHAFMRQSLTDQIDSQLQRASERSQAMDHGAPPGSGPDSLLGPGQGEYTLTAIVSDGAVKQSGVISGSGTVEEIGTEDAAQLAAIHADGHVHDADLSIGDYRVIAADTDSGLKVVTGLPTSARDDSLRSLDLTLGGVGAGALVLCGLAGSLIIRRKLSPLDDVAGVARHVADSPLAAGEVDLADRVPERIAGEKTEVGEVGSALNLMLDNVSSALEARQKSEDDMRRFVADASHELRTPLTAVRGYTELLRMTENLSSDGSKNLERVESQARRMAALVEDMLLLARLDAGADAQLEDVDLIEQLTESLVDAQVSAPDHLWRAELPEDEIEIRADRRQSQQVMSNLLSNARKHTPPGTTVTVSAGRGAQDGPDAGLAWFTVADTGPGIEPSVRDTLFSRFTRADKVRSGTDGSSGLGLSIVDAVVRSHGGRIDVASRPGRTVFTVLWPLAGASSA